MVFALCAFITVFAFLRRALPDDGLAAVASALIGSILLIAAVAGFQYTIRPTKSAIKQPRAELFSNGVVRCIAAVLGVAAVMGGIGFVHDSIIVLNQEYLHWFESSLSIYSASSSQETFIAESAVMGFLFLTIGLFLLWYAVHPLSRVASFIRVAAQRFGLRTRATISDLNHASDDAPK